MVLSGQNIKEAVAQGAIRIAPYDSGQVNPVSYDLRLHRELRSPNGRSVVLKPNGGWLRKGEYWIGRSVEEIAFPSGGLFATLHNKSGTARQGVTAHLTANIIQPDHEGPVRFFIDVVEDVYVWPEMPYAQLKPMALEDFVVDEDFFDAVARKEIRISEFDPAQARGASYRLRLDSMLTSVDGRRIIIPETGARIYKGEFWTGESIEHLSFGHSGLMASLHNRATTASLGTTAHMCAGIIQPDHEGPVRFHIRPTQDCVLYPEMEFAQVTFVRALDREHIRIDAERTGGVVLDRSAIAAAIHAGDITVDPLQPEAIGLGDAAKQHHVGIDFHLGNELKACIGIDAEGKQIFAPVPLPPEGITLEPGVLYLGHTMEVIGSKKYSMALHGLESIASLSLEPQIDADLGHTGVEHQWTLEIRCVERVKVEPGMRIGQVLFEAVRGPVIQYDGKHAQHNGAQESLAPRFEPLR